MSFETWKAEFYPVDASYVAEEKSIQHSLTKWIGLRPENLKRHGLRVQGSNLYEDNIYVFTVDGNTCALCHVYLGRNEDDMCAKCPLYQLLGESCDGGINRPFDIFCSSDNPEPMIDALGKLNLE